MAFDGSAKAVTTFVAGLNAFGQLCEAHSEDVRSFQKKLEVLATTPESGRLFFAGWSSTVLRGAGDVGNLLSLGYGEIRGGTDTDCGRLSCAVGDHNGLKACLDHEGHLYVVESDSSDNSQGLQRRSTEASPLLSQLALAQNGCVALTFRQAPNGRLCHVVEFATFHNFLAWFQEPSDESNRPEQHHMLPGRPKQLVGNTATFLLLMESGEVYTWGDARHESLGRAIGGDDSIPADKPGAVDALGGLNIAKVAGGGWIGAALSEDGALYVWGQTLHGEKSISALSDTESGDVNLIQLPGPQAEPLDVIDVAVGDGHIAVVTEGHRLFVVGENSQGQLGLGSAVDFCEDWQEVRHPDMTHSNTIEGVGAGPKCTFAYVARDPKSGD